MPVAFLRCPAQPAKSSSTPARSTRRQAAVPRLYRPWPPRFRPRPAVAISLCDATLGCAAMRGDLRTLAAPNSTACAATAPTATLPTKADAATGGDTAAGDLDRLRRGVCSATALLDCRGLCAPKTTGPAARFARAVPPSACLGSSGTRVPALWPLYTSASDVFRRKRLLGVDTSPLTHCGTRPSVGLPIASSTSSTLIPCRMRKA